MRAEQQLLFKRFETKAQKYRQKAKSSFSTGIQSTPLFLEGFSHIKGIINKSNSKN